MKVKETKVDYINIVDIGRFAFILEFAEDGIEFDQKNLILQASVFNTIYIKGSYNNKELNEFVKSLKKINKNIHIVVETNSNIEPLLTDDVKYYCFMYYSMINTLALEQYNELNSVFIFSVNAEEDIEKVIELMNLYHLKKQKVFVNLTEKPEMLKYCKSLGINYTISVNFEEEIV